MAATVWTGSARWVTMAPTLPHTRALDSHQGERMGSTLRLTSEEAVARLRGGLHERTDDFHAMYSSVLGGIVTDAALMVVPARRSHGASRPRRIRHRGDCGRHALPTRSAPRTSAALGRRWRAYPCPSSRSSCGRSSSTPPPPAGNAMPRYATGCPPVPAASVCRRASASAAVSYVMIFRPQPEPAHFYTEGRQARYQQRAHQAAIFSRA